jgi:hypothetical protein
MEVKKTITSIFIVPTLGIDKENLNANGFINGYIKDDRKDVQYENAVYLLFHPKDLYKFKSFLDEEYERTKNILDDYDYEDGYIVVVYLLNPDYTKDYQLVKQGKYSKTSKEFQTLFPKIIKIVKNGLRKDEISLQYRVFNKTEDLKKFWEDKLDVTFDQENEIWHGFVEEKEVLNLDKIKQYV